MICSNIDIVTYCIGNLSRRLGMTATEVYGPHRIYEGERSAFMMPVHNETFHAILEAKYARIITAISELHDISLWVKDEKI